MIKIFSILLMACLGALVYSNSFHCSFHFDDQILIAGNDAIKDIHNLQQIWNFLPCRFLFYLSVAFNYHFWKFEVFSYHVVNLIIHLLAAIFAWWLTLLTLSTPAFKAAKLPKEKKSSKAAGKNPTAMTQPADNPIVPHAQWIALFVGLIFVSHPIQTQAVTYIMQRAASMGTMFYLAALCLYIKSRLAQVEGRSGIVYYIAAFFVALMAMFTKEISITLPLMIVWYEFCFFKTGKGLHWKSMILFLLMIFIIPGTMYLNRAGNAISVREMTHALHGESEISSGQYLLTQFRVIVTYLRLLVLPIHQNVDYDYTWSKSLFELPTLISFLFLLSILFAARQLFAKYRLLAFAIGWFFIALIPESSIFPIKDVIFEHRLYLPMVGYGLFLVGGLYYLIGKRSLPAMMIILTVIIGINSFLTYQRNKLWVDEFTLWNDAIQKSPHKARPYNNRGKVYLDENKFSQALADFNQAIELDPKYTDALYNRGNTFYHLNQYPQALADYQRVVDIEPNYSKGVYNNRGVIYASENRIDEAIDDFNKAIIMTPNDPGIYINRGRMYDRKNEFTQAMADYNHALEIDPNSADAYNNRGTSEASQGDYGQAMIDFNKAIALNPKFAQAYDNFGLAWDKQGNFIQALINYNKALQLNPRDAETYYNRGLNYARQGKFAQALADLTKLVGIGSKKVQALNNIGLIYQKLGRPDQAIKAFSQAINVDAGCVDAYTNRGITYAGQNNFTQAIADFTQAIALNPQSVEAYSNRGVSYAKENDFAKAVLDDSKAVELNPQFALGYSNRAIAYYQLKEYDKALADEQKAESMGAGNASLLNAIKQATAQPS